MSPASGQSEGRFHQKLNAILRLCQKMNSERNLDVLLDLVAREATHLLECDRASIFLLDRERSELWSKVALGSDEILRFEASKGIAGVAATTGQIVNVEDAYRDARFNQAIDDHTGYHTRTLLAVPLQKIDGEIIGAFEVLNKLDGIFSAEDEEVLKSLAAQVAMSIQNAQFIGSLRRDQAQLEQENAQLWREVEQKFSARIVGNSPKIQNVLRLIERIRDSSVNVLVGGESGTGKELVAKAVHYTSLRARRPFVALNCAALPETLVESELFGIEKGVATGVQQRAGRFQAASGGTLFLDEVADLSLTAQAKILRVLQERVVERVGSQTPVPVDVRVISATNKDLESEIRTSRFREDLYYRLKVIHIHLPALREIREDIPLLANHLLAQSCRSQGKQQLQFSSAVMRHFVEAPWPGNVRQLQNEVWRLVACARRDVITEEEWLEGLPESAGAQVSRSRLLRDLVEDVERRTIREALESTAHNQQRAARLLGMSRQGLINKMKRYGLRSGPG